ncbi:MAG: HEAT repeat domain-containing protein [Acidobacteriota bacterium]
MLTIARLALGFVVVSRFAPAPPAQELCVENPTPLGELRAAMDDAGVPVTWWIDPPDAGWRAVRFTERGSHEDVEGTMDGVSWRPIATVWIEHVVASEVIQGSRVAVTQRFLDNISLWMERGGVTLRWTIDFDAFAPLAAVQIRYRPPTIEVLGDYYGEGWSHLCGLDATTLELYGSAVTGWPGLVTRPAEDGKEPWPIAGDVRSIVTAGFADPAPAVRQAAADALFYEKRYRDSSWTWGNELLVVALDDSDAGVQAEGLTALGEQDYAFPDARDVVRRLLRHEDSRVRSAAVRAALALGEEPDLALDVVLKLAADVDALLGPTEESPLYELDAALETIGPETPLSIERLVEALDDSRVAVRYVAAHALGAMGEAAQGAADDLRRAAADGDPRVARQAAASLREVTAPPCR